MDRGGGGDGGGGDGGGGSAMKDATFYTDISSWLMERKLDGYLIELVLNDIAKFIPVRSMRDETNMIVVNKSAHST